MEALAYATQSNFYSLCDRLRVEAEGAQQIFQCLSEAYGQSFRSYHNLVHIDYMFQTLAGHNISSSPALDLAIWFHDIVYEIGGVENEQKSAECFAGCFDGLIGQVLQQDVTRLILATDFTKVATNHPEANLIIDLDLSILGASPERYAKYQREIRQENREIPEDIFVRARSKILQSFLAKPIYRTSFFTGLEKQARDNLRRELAELNV